MAKIKSKKAALPVLPTKGPEVLVAAALEVAEPVSEPVLETVETSVEAEKPKVWKCGFCQTINTNVSRDQITGWCTTCARANTIKWIDG